MKHDHRIIGARGRQLGFLAAGWIMLAVILIFAAAAGGQPQPRLRLNGSAFDPSSSTVALKSAKPKPAAKLAPARNDLPDHLAAKPAFPAGLAFYPVSAVWLPNPTSLVRFARDVAAPLLRSHASSLGARAPPPN